VHGAVCALGYPAPRVVACGGPEGELGRAFLILERVPGRRMLDPLLAPGSLGAPGLLAAAQARLHALEPCALERALEAAGIGVRRLSLDSELAELEAGCERLSLAGLRPGLRWLAAHRPELPARAICHGDFHPLNVLVAGGAVSGVVDWARARICDPAYDAGVTLALLRLGPLELPAPLAGLARAGRSAFVAAYRRAYARRRELDADAVAWCEALRCLVILLEVGEHLRADAGRAPRPSKPTAFGSPRARAAVVARFRALSGVGVDPS
jgi:aminoglycoside phosphotransferase (APT) family kinase protein